MENPGVKTLKTFLKTVKNNQPANYSAIAVTDEGKIYGQATRYINYCLKQGLIKVVGTTKGRGRPGKLYALTPQGIDLLDSLGGINKNGE